MNAYSQSAWASAGRSALCLMLASAALAQQPVSQDGRLLDANPQLGYGRINSPRPVSPFAIGNSIASGNVKSGFALRSFSPISDPTAFRGQLGSATLSDFRRDSVGLRDINGPYGALGVGPRLYYDAAQTAMTPGFLQSPAASAIPSIPQSARPDELKPSGIGVQGLNDPLDMRIDMRANLAARVRPEPEKASRAGEYSSSLFGFKPALPLSPVQQAEADRARTTVVNPRSATVQSGNQTAGPAEMSGTALDAALRASPSQLLTSAPDSGGSLPGVVFNSAENTKKVLASRSRRDADSGGLRPTPAALRITDASSLPGHNVYTDMRLALALSRDPRGEWFAQMQDATKSDPTLTREMRDFAAQDAQAFLNEMLQRPIRTFVGHGASEVNNELLKAESLLAAGKYNEAVARYEQARLLDPANPLPLVGKAHGLLAAGDYASAAQNLIRGIERFPELSQFNVDLETLVGGAETVDIRRSDLINRLKESEDSRLRFLLGYLEYYTGNRVSGLENLSKAASARDADPLVARFPAMLRGEGAQPPPKLDVPPAPIAPPIAPIETHEPRSGGLIIPPREAGELPQPAKEPR